MTQRTGRPSAPRPTRSAPRDGLLVPRRRNQRVAQRGCQSCRVESSRAATASAFTIVPCPQCSIGVVTWSTRDRGSRSGRLRPACSRSSSRRPSARAARPRVVVRQRHEGLDGLGRALDVHRIEPVVEVLRPAVVFEEVRLEVAQPPIESCSIERLSFDQRSGRPSAPRGCSRCGSCRSSDTSVLRRRTRPRPAADACTYSASRPARPRGAVRSPRGAEPGQERGAHGVRVVNRRLAVGVVAEAAAGGCLLRGQLQHPAADAFRDVQVPPSPEDLEGVEKGLADERAPDQKGSPRAGVRCASRSDTDRPSRTRRSPARDCGSASRDRPPRRSVSAEPAAVHEQVAPCHVAATDGGFVRPHAEQRPDVERRAQDDLLQHAHRQDPAARERKEDGSVAVRGLVGR